MDGNTKEVTLIKIFIIGAVIALTGLFTSCSVQNWQDDNAIVQMVSKGASALEARCAIHPGNDGTICPIVAAKK